MRGKSIHKRRKAMRLRMWRGWCIRRRCRSLRHEGRRHDFGVGSHQTRVHFQLVSQDAQLVLLIVQSHITWQSKRHKRYKSKIAGKKIGRYAEREIPIVAAGKCFSTASRAFFSFPWNWVSWFVTSEADTLPASFSSIVLTTSKTAGRRDILRSLSCSIPFSRVALLSTSHPPTPLDLLLPSTRGKAGFVSTNGDAIVPSKECHVKLVDSLKLNTS